MEQNNEQLRREEKIRRSKEIAEMIEVLTFLTPKELFKWLDLKFYEARKKRLSRYSIEWGTWSVPFNLFLRKVCNSKDKKRQNMGVGLFAYWITLSERAQLSHKWKIFSDRKDKKLQKECIRLRRLTLRGEYHYNIDYEKVFKMLKVNKEGEKNDGKGLVSGSDKKASTGAGEKGNN